MSNPFRPVSPSSSSFLPEDYVARKTETRVNVLILTLFALVMAGVVGAFFVTNRRWETLRDRQAIVNDQFVQEDKKIEQLKALESQRAQMMEKAEITASLLDRVPRWAVLGELTLRTPSGARLESLIIKSTRKDPVVLAAADKKPAPVVKSLTDTIKGAPPPKPERPKVTPTTFTYAMTIVGGAPTNSDVADFLKSLKSSPIFDKVELTYIREARVKDKDYRKFEISATVRTDTDTKVLAASLQKLKAERTAALEGRKNPEGGPVDPNAVPTANVPQIPLPGADLNQE